MATYTTFLDSGQLMKVYNINQAMRFVRVRMNFASRTLAVGSTHQVISVPADSMVIMCWPTVKTAGTANGRMNLGYGTGAQVYHWGKSIPIDVAGTKTGIMGTSAATNDPSAFSAHTDTATNALFTQTSTNMNVSAAYADLGDLVQVAPSIDLAENAVGAYVIATGTNGNVEVLLSNAQNATSNLGAIYMTAFVDKAPMSKVPVYFASADTIDVTGAGSATLATGIVEIWAMILSCKGYF